MNLEPLYYLSDRTVYRRPIRKKQANGRIGITVGFPVCIVHEMLSEPKQLLDILNKGDPPDPDEPTLD